MDRLSAMELFVVAIDEGSLSGGARRLGRPAAAATRAVTMLEHETDEILLVRSTRRIALTAAGEHWLDIWRSVLGQLAAGRGGPSFGGKVVLTAPELFGRTWVQPLVEAFLRKHPKVEARLLLLDRIVDLLEEGVDLAIRVGELPENGVATTRLGQVHFMPCAAPAYIERRGKPLEPAELRRHDCIGFADGSEAWRFLDPAHGKVRSVVVPLRFSVNNAGSVLEATLRGNGIGQILSCQASEHIKEDRLVPVLTAYEPSPVPVRLVFRGRPPRGGAVRDFVDHVVPVLRQRLADIEATIVQTVASAARR